MHFVCPDELVALAHQLSDIARPIAAHYFRNDDLVVELKSAHDPVTIADRLIEEKWREIIMARRPQDGIWGEEYGRHNIDAELTWIFDPIDGTKIFTLGRATFGTLIGLYHRTHGFILGVIDQPIVGLRWVGAKNCGATLNGKKLGSKETPDISHWRSSINNLPRLPAELQALNDQLRNEVHFISFGGDCMNYAGLADGALHYYFDNQQQIFDFAAVIPILNETGGVLTQIDGSPIGMEEKYYTVLGGATKEIHEQVLAKYRAIAK